MFSPLPPSHRHCVSLYVIIVLLSQVTDSLKNIHRVLVESGPSFSKNILDLVISSTKCSVSSISEIRTLYQTLFVQGSLLTARYMVLKKFPESSVKRELESIREMFIASNFRLNMSKLYINLI